VKFADYVLGYLNNAMLKLLLLGYQSLQ